MRNQLTSRPLDPTAGHFVWRFAGNVLLGVGTAMVYPSLIAAVSDASHPSRRARSLSVYRFWRDLGYAIGASPPASLRIGLALPPRSLLSRGSHFFPEPLSQSACVSTNRAVMRRSLA
jgi:MFS family permease